MTEDSSRFWTTIFGGITAIGLVAGGIYSVVQYFNTKETDQRNFGLQLANASLEAKKPFFSKRLELCEEASSAAATRATTDDKVERKKAEASFWRLYWGPLGIVENESVAGAMVEFGECLQSGCQGNSLQRLALKLAHSCRQEMSESWDMKLPSVKPRPFNKRPDN
jgi:hypothetical protein